MAAAVVWAYLLAVLTAVVIGLRMLGTPSLLVAAVTVSVAGAHVITFTLMAANRRNDEP